MKINVGIVGLLVVLVVVLVMTTSHPLLTREGYAQPNSDPSPATFVFLVIFVLIFGAPFLMLFR